MLIFYLTWPYKSHKNLLMYITTAILVADKYKVPNCNIYNKYDFSWFYAS